MAEVTNELIYDVLKSVQTRALALGVNATNTDVANLYRMLGTLDNGLGRIERRLDIVEPVK